MSRNRDNNTNPPGYQSESRQKGFGVKKTDGDGSEWRAIHGKNDYVKPSAEQQRHIDNSFSGYDDFDDED